jgi:hypothetical protein
MNTIMKKLFDNEATKKEGNGKHVEIITEKVDDWSCSGKKFEMFLLQKLSYVLYDI